MPFMKGLAPVRRTINYLNKGSLVFKDQVKVVAFHLCTKKEQKNHMGTKEFLFWHLPQLQYKNPDVQIVSFKNLTPTPFIRCYFDNDEQIIIDVDNKSRTEIMDTVKKVIGKSDKELQEESLARVKQDNPANFGTSCSRHCICEIMGQVPCPSVVKLPDRLRAKMRNAS